MGIMFCKIVPCKVSLYGAYVPMSCIAKIYISSFPIKQVGNSLISTEVWVVQAMPY